MVELGRVASVSHRALAMSQAVSRTHTSVSRAPSGHDTKTVSRLNSCRAHYALCHERAQPYRRPCRSTLLPCRSAVSQHAAAVSQHAGAVSQRCIAALLRHIVTQTVAPDHDTKFVSQLTPWLGHHLARALLAPARKPALSWPLLAVSRPLLAVSWPPAACPSALCHDTFHCIMTQTRKWAVAHPVSCLFCNFFFHIISIFFFICSSYYKTTKKILFFFSCLQ